MMNAKEAKQMTITYVNNLVKKYITDIEETIKSRASKGYDYAYCAKGINNEDARIKTGLFSVLQEAGYKISWCETQIYISWGNA